MVIHVPKQNAKAKAATLKAIMDIFELFERIKSRLDFQDIDICNLRQLLNVRSTFKHQRLEGGFRSSISNRDTWLVLRHFGQWLDLKRYQC
ncbi:hypothetical protein GMOD_00010091 [Pyrenophora seminiperda CCB06]|uniref:Uncharacterized protein n=1 Tax=Pyrenophora seminiperda CCB06 TaxID=1302712 RepID=A0A3M7LZX2_9PLEO|nr:hypothetical protein GMOD_00010091 [Pyrenophora seminiperda CCB06]